MYIRFEYIHRTELHHGSLNGKAENMQVAIKEVSEHLENMQVAIKEVSEHLDTHFNNWELVKITLDDIRAEYTPAERIGY